MLTSFLFCYLIEVLKAQADRNKPMMGLVRSPVGMAWRPMTYLHTGLALAKPWLTQKLGLQLLEAQNEEPLLVQIQSYVVDAFVSCYYLYFLCGSCLLAS